MVGIVDPLSHRTSYGYVPVERQITVENPLGDVSTTVYDPVGQTIAEVDPLGRKGKGDILDILVFC